MAGMTITVNADNTDIDVALKKARKLYKYLKKAKKLAGEIEGMKVESSISAPESSPFFGGVINCKGSITTAHNCKCE